MDILVRDPKGLAALGRLDELAICEAYMVGSLDVVGDMLRFVGLRGVLSDSHPLVYLWRRIAPWLIGRCTTNRQAIATHYELGNDFYLEFLDSTRCYSQAVFERDDEALETVQSRKLNFAAEYCRLKPGDRVLDVGGGWGSFTEHAGRRRIQVTALTISHKSVHFLTDLIQRLQLPARVLNRDCLKYDSPEPYDAIVILGVMEHLPDYPAVLAVYNDRHSYYLTCKAWAESLEAARDEIINRWGEALYRRFRLYLWGSAYAFLNRGMGAYRVLLERPR